MKIKIYIIINDEEIIKVTNSKELAQITFEYYKPKFEKTKIIIKEVNI